jgi:putative ABC transport system permease protein
VETIRVAQGQAYRGDRVAAVALSDGLLRAALGTAVQTDGAAGEVEQKLLSGEAVAVSNNFSRRYGVMPGQTLEVATPTGALTLPVVAVIPDYVSDRGSFLLSRDLYRKRWGDRLLTFFSVSLTEGATVEALRRDVARVLGAESRLAVMSSADLRGRTDRAIATAFADVESIQLLLAVITLVGIVDFLVTSTLDRRRELALLATIGVTLSGVRRAITLEAATIGLTAGVVGAILGIFFSWVWIEYTYPVLVGYVLELSVAARTVAFIVVAATATAALTGALAVRGVLSRSLAEGIRVE